MEGTDGNQPSSLRNTMECTNDNLPPSLGSTTEGTDGNPPPSSGNTGDCTSALCQDGQPMTDADIVMYDKSKKPNNIDWMSDDFKAKIAPYKPSNMSLSNTKNDQCAADAAFVAIFAPISDKTFIWFNQYQVE